MKTCTKCGKPKPPDGFDKQNYGALGRRAECKSCRSVRHSKYDRREYYRKYQREHGKKYRDANPEKCAARKDVRLAVLRGDLVKPDRCEECDDSGPIQAHHEDYSKPLQVDWLCKPCHLARH